MGMADRFEVERYIWALARAKGDLHLATQIAAENQMTDRIVNVLRAAVGSGTTLDAGSLALIEARTMSAGFVDELRSLSFVQAIYNDCVRPGFQTSVNFATLGFSGGIISDGALKILSKMSIDEATGGKLAPKTVCVMGVFTDELLRVLSPGTLATLRAAMAGAVATALDQYAIGELLDGVSVGASSGDVAADVRTLLGTVNTKGVGRFRFAMTPDVANQISTLKDGEQLAYPTVTPVGGTLAGIPITVTDTLPIESAGQVGMMLVEAGGIAAEIEQAPRFAVATAAALDVQDDATGSAANLVSLYMTNSVAIRAELFAAVRKIRPTSVAALADCDYQFAS
jgi:hypothetical protein